MLTTDGCGPGQECESGKCTPAVGFKCSNGETNPSNKDTFGDGKLDNERGTFICRDATEDKPQGRKADQQALQTTDRRLAHGPGDHRQVRRADDHQRRPPRRPPRVIDEDGTLAEVAGFVISRDTTNDKVQDDLSARSCGASPPRCPAARAR